MPTLEEDGLPKRETSLSRKLEQCSLSCLSGSMVEKRDHIVASYFSQAYVALGKVNDFIDKVENDVGWFVRFPGESDPCGIFSRLFPNADPKGVIIWIVVTKSAADVYEHMMEDSLKSHWRKDSQKSVTGPFSEYIVRRISDKKARLLLGLGLG